MNSVAKYLLCAMGSICFIGCGKVVAPINTHELDSLNGQYIDSVYYNPLRQRDSTFCAVLQSSNIEHKEDVMLMRFWADSVLDINNYDSYAAYLFAPNPDKDFKIWSLGAHKLITARLNPGNDSYHALHLFLIDQNEKIICHKVIDMLRKELVSQRLVDWNGDNYPDLVLRLLYHPQQYVSNYELVYNFKDKTFELIFAFELSSEGSCIELIKTTNHYRAIGGNKFKVTSNIKESQYNEELDSRYWIYRTETSIVSLDELINNFDYYK